MLFSRYIVIGLTLLALGSLATAAWWLSVESFIRGFIPLFLIAIGVIAFSAGYREILQSGDERQISRLKEFLLKEDWWAIYLGLSFVFIGISAISSDQNFGFLQLMATNPASVKWQVPGQLMDHFAGNLHLYLFQFIIWAAIFAASCRVMGIAVKEFLLSFIFSSSVF